MHNGQRHNGMRNKSEFVGLIPLRHIIGKYSLEERNLERLKAAWPLFVGQGNCQISRPISIRQGLLLVGCFNPSVLEDLRKSAKKNWPVLRNRINSVLKLHLQRMEVVPSDPELVATRSVPTSLSESVDPLELVLMHYRNSKRNFIK